MTYGKLRIQAVRIFYISQKLVKATIVTGLCLNEEDQ